MLNIPILNKIMLNILKLYIKAVEFKILFGCHYLKTLCKTTVIMQGESNMLLYGSIDGKRRCLRVECAEVEEIR